VTRLAVLLAIALLPAGVLAHGRSVSYSSWTATATGAHVEIRIAAIDVTLLGLDPWGDGERLAGYATAHVEARHGDRPCAVAGAPVRSDPQDGWMVLAWDVTCAGAPTAVRSTLFDDVAPSHLHFARLASATGGVAERVLTADAPVWTLDAAPATSGSSFADYVGLGVEHIRTGFDHLAFVTALLLLAGTLAEVATIVTAFTIAHSLTLAVAVLGLVRPEPSAVEALIGFSVALVATENAWILGGRDRATPWLVGGALVVTALVSAGRVGTGTLLGLALFSICHLGLLAGSERPERLRAAVAFGFGLVHGFGFAGVLASLDLPRARLVSALLGFNVGVELGQLAVVTAGWLVLATLERGAPGARRRVAELGSAAICGLGLFWFVVRGWG
jgi:hypothetical protein